MPERFNIECEGGPHPGLYPTDSDQNPWPLPGFINDFGGKYVKVFETTASPQGKNSLFIRYATYEWRTNEQLAQDAR